MFAKCVEANGKTYDSRSAAQNICYDEEETTDLASDRSTNDVGHISNRMAVRMSVAEISLHNGKVSVKHAPANNAEGTSNCT